MSKFTGNLRYEEADDGMYRITESVRFYWNDDLTGEYVELPVGALVNFASIPKLAQIIFKPDQEDVKMTSAFHDLMVGEFGKFIAIMNDGKFVRWPSWSESADWFRRGMDVRQSQTRRHLPQPNKVIVEVYDFIKRWSFWGLVMIHGVLR